MVQSPKAHEFSVALAVSYPRCYAGITKHFYRKQHPMFPKQIKSMFMFQIAAGFFWLLTIVSAIVFVVGAFVADWSWSLLWISAGGLVVTMILTILAFNRFFAAGNEMNRGF